MKSELFQKIVLATDGSEYSANVIKYAIELAKISEAKIYAIYVVDTGIFTSIPMDVAWTNMYELLKQEGNVATNQVESEAMAANIEVESITVEGHPAEEIIKLAEDKSADIIVMGTLGKSGLDRFLLGSVAEKVSRTSKIPVMIVRGEKPK
ncbi:MAG TPA: universal stress protein [Candidatus Nanoarchaeia archaeon]|nr:universal stress protein [Candidatus Nanoarchaeia archaeon]